MAVEMTVAALGCALAAGLAWLILQGFFALTFGRWR
jgi:hypothetical protein